ncbi:MAG: hypothetical protein OHK0015_39910 [Chloroflexi bacterium OHK40]
MLDLLVLIEANWEPLRPQAQLLSSLAVNVRYWLRRQRLARHWRQDDLAARLGVATVTLRKLEAARCIPTHRTRRWLWFHPASRWAACVPGARAIGCDGARATGRALAART